MFFKVEFPILGGNILSSCINCEYNGQWESRLSPTTPKLVLAVTTEHNILSLNLTEVSSPALVLFTLNFTINNLRYMEDMQLPSSAKFSKIEKILQDLVRAPPTSCPHCPLMSTPPTTPRTHPPHPTS